MPHFTLQIGSAGPTVKALVGVSEARASALTEHDKAVPDLAPFVALVDTGASCTCLDPSILAPLRLMPTGTASISTPSTGATPHETYQYDVSIYIPSVGGHLSFKTIPVIESDLKSQGIDGLLGRDILDRCLFSYNGSMKLFTLAF